MNGHTFRRWGVLVLVAAAAGCTGVAPALPTLPAWGKSRPAEEQNPPAGYAAARPAGQPPPTGVVPAGGQTADPVAQSAPASPPAAALPPPQALTPGTPPVDPAAGAPSKFPPPAYPPPGYPIPGYPPLADPHARTTPTITGGRWNLGPGEVPADRVAELSRSLELALGQNRELLVRIRELEALGLGREQALAEAMREVEAAAAEVTRTRATLLSLRGELAAAQKQLQAMEVEDIKIFEGVIRALDKLLPPLPPPGRTP